MDLIDSKLIMDGSRLERESFMIQKEMRSVFRYYRNQELMLVKRWKDSM